MERNFDLHVSAQFKGGQYFRSFSAKTYSEFENALCDAWYDTGLSINTGEIFIYTLVDLENGPYNFEVGCYKVEQDNETIIGLTSIPDPRTPEHLICNILNIDINDPLLRYDEEGFFEIVSRAIVKHTKSWCQLSQTTLKRVQKSQQNLVNKAKQRLKEEAYYQCISCSWVGASQERLVQYFDFNEEPADDPNTLRERLNNGPNRDEQWLKSTYVRLCPKCLQQTKVSEEGEALFNSAMDKKQMGYDDSSFGGIFRGKENAQELARIESCYGNEEARISCNPSQLYEAIRFHKLTNIYEQIMANNDNLDLFNPNQKSGSLTRLFDEIYKEVFFETLHYGS